MILLKAKITFRWREKIKRRSQRNGLIAKIKNVVALNSPFLYLGLYKTIIKNKIHTNEPIRIMIGLRSKLISC